METPPPCPLCLLCILVRREVRICKKHWHWCWCYITFLFTAFHIPWWPNFCGFRTAMEQKKCSMEYFFDNGVSKDLPFCLRSLQPMEWSATTNTIPFAICRQCHNPLVAIWYLLQNIDIGLIKSYEKLSKTFHWIDT